MSNNLLKEFAGRLKSAQKRAGKNITDIASELGVKSGNIGNWRVGRNFPNPPDMARLADSLGVSVDWLLGRGTDDPESSIDPATMSRLEVWARKSEVSPSVFLDRLLSKSALDVSTEIQWERGGQPVAWMTKGEKFYVERDGRMTPISGEELSKIVARAGGVIAIKTLSSEPGGETS